MATKSETARTTATPAAEAPAASSKRRPSADPLALEPSAAELDRWAAQERERREAWLRGPTEEERAEFIRHERRAPSRRDRGRG